MTTRAGMLILAAALFGCGHAGNDGGGSDVDMTVAGGGSGGSGGGGSGGSGGGGSGGSGGGGSGGSGGGGAVDAGNGDTSAWLHTSGNGIYHADGTRFHGKGVDIPDQRGDDACYATPDVGEENRRIDELATWGANFIRLTLESDKAADDVSNDPSYLQDLQTVVAHATGKGIYVEVSLWVDPTVDGNELPTAASNAEWTVLATAFANDPHVLFGITNEPHDTTDAAVWTAMNTAVANIRTAETKAGAPEQHIILVQGTQGYARQTQYYVTHPITAGGGTNIAYETHVYNPQSDFDAMVTTPAKSIPLIIGEFGPVGVGGSSGNAPGVTMTVADCQALITLAKQQEVPFLAWSFHMRTPPNLLVDNSSGGCGIGMTLTPTSDWGVPLKAALTPAW